MTKRIAIVGSGTSGLSAIKCCLDEGLEPVCFERTDHIGGLWAYTEKPVEGQSCVMRSTIINTSKETTSYSDFPPPAENEVYMHNTKLRNYFQSYADSFNAEKYTRFQTEVMKVSQSRDFAETGRWNIVVKYHVTDKTTTEVFDGVLVCTGHHAEKKVPTFEGLMSV